MRNYILAGLLVLLALGCLNQTAGDTTAVTLAPDGLRVVAFEPDKNPMRAGEEIGLFMQYQNVGGSEANTISVTPKRTGRLTVTQASAGENYLFPPDERARIPGGTTQTFFTVTAPDVDFPETYSLNLELEYDYSTRILREIPVYTIDRLNELRESTYEAKKGNIQKTLGPVDIDIQIEDPIQVPVSGAKKCISDTAFDIILNNVGGGSIKGTTGLNSIDSIGVELQSTGSDTVTCIDTVPTWESVRDDDGEANEGINLRFDAPQASQSFATKSISIDNSPTSAKLWIYAQYDDIHAGDFSENFFIEVNGNPAHITFDPAQFSSSHDEDFRLKDFGWVSFDIPTALLHPGINTFKISPSAPGRGLVLARDTDTVNGNSEWKGQYPFTGDSISSDGSDELMIYLDFYSEASQDITSVNLWKGQNARVHCNLHMDLDPENDGTCELERFPVLVAKANYHYALDKSINIEVEP